MWVLFGFFLKAGKSIPSIGLKQQQMDHLNRPLKRLFSNSSGSQSSKKLKPFLPYP